MCLSQKCVSHVGDAPTIKSLPSLDSPVGLRQTVSVLAWNTIKENRFPVWCQDTCNSISTKPNLPETKIKPDSLRRSFSLWFYWLWSSPSIFKRSQANWWVHWLVQNKKKNPISRNTIQSFLFLRLCQAEVPAYLRKILTPSLTFASCLVTLIILCSFNAFDCDVMWTYLCRTR